MSRFTPLVTGENRQHRIQEKANAAARMGHKGPFRIASGQPAFCHFCKRNVLGGVSCERPTPSTRS